MSKKIYIRAGWFNARLHKVCLTGVRSRMMQSLVMMVLQNSEVEERDYGLCMEITRQVGYSNDILDELTTKLAVTQVWPDPII